MSPTATALLLMASAQNTQASATGGGAETSNGRVAPPPVVETIPIEVPSGGAPPASGEGQEADIVVTSRRRPVVDPCAA